MSAPTRKLPCAKNQAEARPITIDAIDTWLGEIGVWTSNFDSGRPSGRLKKRSTRPSAVLVKEAQSFLSASAADVASEINVAITPAMIGLGSATVIRTGSGPLSAQISS